MSAPRLAFVGTGAVATALAVAWSAAKGHVTVIVSRDPARAAALAAHCGARPSTDVGDLRDADVAVVAVPDRAVAEVGGAIAHRLGTVDQPLVLHTSGALGGSELFRAAGATRLRAGSLHPLQSFPASSSGGQAELAARVGGTHWFHEGAGSDLAREMVARWGGIFHALRPGGKSLYHAGAAILSNHAVSLFADATRLFAAAGVAPADARPALAALLSGTAANLAAVGVPDALTGPVARGDVPTVRRHVDALRASAPEILAAYREMARRTVLVAREKGSIDAETAAALEEALD